MSGVYKAATCTRLDGPSCIEIIEIERQPLAEGMVRVGVRASGVNYPDYLMTKGEYQLKLDPPFTPGMEVAGVVLETDGSAGMPAVGSNVMAAMRNGGFAEEVMVARSAVLPLPSVFSFEEGACFGVAAQTAYHALVSRGQLAPGSTVLVLGATGGVGLAAVQLAAHLGARVIAVGSSDAKLAIAKRLGADTVINYSQHDLIAEVKRATGTVDIVFDPVGGPLAITAARLLDWNGRFLIVGFASGEIPQFAANLALIKGYSIIGVRAGEAARRSPRDHGQSVKALLQAAATGEITPHISHRFTLGESSEALDALAERKVIGRVVITHGATA